jgi:uncharacterized ion transporter superfamily protein YfcC
MFWFYDKMKREAEHNIYYKKNNENKRDMIGNRRKGKKRNGRKENVFILCLFRSSLCGSTLHCVLSHEWLL